MNTRAYLLITGLLTGAASARAAVFDFPNINAAIPDGIPSGLADFRTITTEPGQTITDLNVTLSISGTGLGGFNGDLFATLQHESGYAVLLNRVGSRAGFPSGYSDGGLNVILDDQGGADIHSYRFTVNGSHGAPVSGALGGTWAPDGRNADPATVLDTSIPSAYLESFNGTPINGDWTLFITDLSSGGTHQLNGWAMNATITPVPEIRSFSLLAGVGLLGFAAAGRFLARKSAREAIFRG